MWFGYLTLVVAFFLSAVAAYYSVLGLVTIFSAAVIPVMIMGGALETGKVVAAMWLHRNWDRVSWAYKSYLLPSLLVLMLLTSMGIFGFLSKAHSDQTLISGDVGAELNLIEERIKISRENIDAARSTLKQMDAAVDQIMGRSTSEQGAERANQIRRQQQTERKRLLDTIDAEQKKIAEYNETRAPIAAKFRQVEAEVGPIKYIYSFFSGSGGDKVGQDLSHSLETAVQWVIVLIVIVFDPLAIVLILAGTKHIELERQARQSKKQLDPQPEPVVEPKVQPPKAVPQSYLSRPWRDRVPGIRVPIQVYRAPTTSTTTTSSTSSTTTSSTTTTLAPSTTTTTTTTTEAQTTTTTTAMPEVIIQSNDYVLYDGKSMSMSVFKSNYPDQYREMLANSDLLLGPINATFGSTLPTAPSKGQMHVHTGTLPNIVYKFNGRDWIEVDKNITETYLNNRKYVAYLTDQVKTGILDRDDLTEFEQIRIQEFINNEQSNNNAT